MASYLDEQHLVVKQEQRKCRTLHKRFFEILNTYLKNDIIEKNLEILKVLKSWKILLHAEQNPPRESHQSQRTYHTEVLAGTGSQIRAMSQSVPSLSSSSYIPLSLLVQTFLNCSSNASEHQWAPACKQELFEQGLPPGLPMDMKIRYVKTLQKSTGAKTYRCTLVSKPSICCYYRQTHGKDLIFFIQDRLW